MMIRLRNLAQNVLQAFRNPPADPPTPVPGFDKIQKTMHEIWAKHPGKAQFHHYPDLAKFLPQQPQGRLRRVLQRLPCWLKGRHAWYYPAHGLSRECRRCGKVQHLNWRWINRSSF